MSWKILSSQNEPSPWLLAVVWNLPALLLRIESKYNSILVTVSKSAAHYQHCQMLPWPPPPQDTSPEEVCGAGHGLWVWRLPGNQLGGGGRPGSGDEEAEERWAKVSTLPRVTQPEMGPTISASRPVMLCVSQSKKNYILKFLIRGFRDESFRASLQITSLWFKDWL